MVSPAKISESLGGGRARAERIRGSQRRLVPIDSLIVVLQPSESVAEAASGICFEERLMEVTRFLKCDLIGFQRVFVQTLIDKDGAACEINFSQEFRMGGGKLFRSSQTLR